MPAPVLPLVAAWYGNDPMQIPTRVTLYSGFYPNPNVAGSSAAFTNQCIQLSGSTMANMANAVGLPAWTDAIAASPLKVQASNDICDAWMIQVILRIGLVAFMTQSAIIRGPIYKRKIKDAETSWLRGDDMGKEWDMASKAYLGAHDLLLRPYRQTVDGSIAFFCPPGESRSARATTVIPFPNGLGCGGGW